MSTPADLIAQATKSLSPADTSAAQLDQMFATAAQVGHVAAWWAFVPLGFALLVLGELHESAQRGTSYQVGKVFIRLGVVITLLLGYSELVRLITGATGGLAKFAHWGDMVKPIFQATEFGLDRKIGESNWAGMPTGETIVQMAIYILMLGILVVCSLFAWVAGLLISFSQALLIAIIVALGKTCIAMSLVPGVSLGKSWANALARVSAWSLVGATIGAVIIARNPFMDPGNVSFAVREGGPLMLKIAAWYAVWGIFTLAVPAITSSVFSGAANMAPAVAGAIAGGFFAARAGAGLVKGVAAGNSPVASGIKRGVHAMGKDVAQGAAQDARRAHKAVMEKVRPLPSSLPAATIPAGHPGASRAPDPARADNPPGIPAGHPGASRAPDPALADNPPGIPAVSRRMQERVAANRSTLQAAYPHEAFDPQNLSLKQRAIMSELDSPDRRFEGWEWGGQGAGDFHSAQGRADSRVRAVRKRQAGQTPDYTAGLRPAGALDHGDARFRAVPSPPSKAKAKAAGKPGTSSPEAKAPQPHPHPAGKQHAPLPAGNGRGKTMGIRADAQRDVKRSQSPQNPSGAPKTAPERADTDTHADARTPRPAGQPGWQGNDNGAADAPAEARVAIAARLPRSPTTAEERPGSRVSLPEREPVHAETPRRDNGGGATVPAEAAGARLRATEPAAARQNRVALRPSSRSADFWESEPQPSGEDDE